MPVQSISPDKNNSMFSLAEEFVTNTSRHIFLTGKAGTGKTTFLKYIRDQLHKNTVVAAPTGVAAINAGGVTLHSLFQLPFAPFVPGNSFGFGTSTANDSSSLLRNLKLNSNKKKLLQELDLLIIDEVSMLRADLLDAIDTILRSVRRNYNEPYGGVQVLFIGDLYQLPPVVPNDEWSLLRQFYEGPFFFNAQVIKQSPPLYIELKKIYRQNEQEFIDILNRIRNNVVLPEDLQLLNEHRLLPNASERPENMITLTTHNRKADAINNEELEKLPARTHRFQGVITNEFNENALPTDRDLYLKEGAQVMFIRNDTGENRRFFNGKLATISSIHNGEIFLIPAGESEEIKLEKETWTNIRYTYNAEKNHIEEEELGSFTQYPIRLAWAITIHKSQGLTFENLVIDTAQAFAAGQVYVALSRCTSLSGLHLISPIYASAIQTDQAVIAFAEREERADELSQLLEEAKQSFVYVRLKKLFEWGKLISATDDFKEEADAKQFPAKQASVDLADSLVAKVQELKTVADRFDQELQRITGNTELLGERLGKAITWFCKSIYESLILPVHHHLASLQGKTRVKLLTETLLETEAVYWRKLDQLQTSSFPEFGVPALANPYKKEALPEIKLKKKGKAEKGSSQKESLQLYLDGHSVAEIAEQRGLTTGTVEGHLAQFVLTGELEPQELISQEKIDAILEVMTDPAESSAVIKEKLPPEYSYNDIRIVANYRKRETSKQS